MLRHCWSGVGLCKGENVVRNEMPVCKVLVHWVQRSSETAAFCWCRFTEHGWQAQRTSWKDHPSAHCMTFSQKNCHALSQWKKKWRLSRHSLIAMKKNHQLKYHPNKMFSFLLFAQFSAVSWREGKDPESPEDCGGELMLLKWTSNKTSLQKSCWGWELPSEPRDSRKGQAGKQKVKVLATCNNSAKSAKPKCIEVSLLITFNLQRVRNYSKERKERANSVCHVYKLHLLFTRLSSLLATMEAKRLSPASSEMRKMYSGAVTWLDRWVRPKWEKKRRKIYCYLQEGGEKHSLEVWDCNVYSSNRWVRGRNHTQPPQLHSHTHTIAHTLTLRGKQSLQSTYCSCFLECDRNLKHLE